MLLHLNRKLFFFLVLLLPTIAMKAQVVINFNAVVYGQSLEGLGFVQLINSSTEDITVTVTIKVRENTAGSVLSATIISVPLRKGSNTLDRAAFSRAKFSFGNNFHGRTLSQSGRFPMGEYEYCFEVEVTESKTAWINPYFENCFFQELQPMTPLLLINPSHEDESCNTRPNFIWQLPSPLPAGARCRLVLTEIMDKQDIAEAIHFNIPLINQSNIPNNQLLFPAGAPSLKEDKKYAWQVVVYSGNAILRRSEIWEYKVKCEKEIKDLSTDSYRELMESNNGGYYTTEKFLRFSLNNPYGPAALSYSIESLSKETAPVQGLPKLAMLPGLNKYSIDLSDIKGLKQGQEYVLRVTLADKRVLQLRFLYQNTLSL